MKCSKCGNDMIQSRAGWLCVECGHIETINNEDKPVVAAAILATPPPKPVTPISVAAEHISPAPAKDDAAISKAPPVVEVAPKADQEPEPEIKPEPDPGIKPEPESIPAPQPEIAPISEPATDPEPDLKPEPNHVPDAEPETKADFETNSEPEHEAKPETESEPEPKADKVPEPPAESKPKHKHKSVHHKVHHKEAKPEPINPDPQSGVPVPIIDLGNIEIAGELPIAEPTVIEIPSTKSPEAVIQESIAEIEQAPEPEVEAESELEPETAPAPEPEPELMPETVPADEPAPEHETVPEPAPDTEPEPAPNPEADSETKPESDTPEPPSEVPTDSAPELPSPEPDPAPTPASEAPEETPAPEAPEQTPAPEAPEPTPSSESAAPIASVAPAPEASPGPAAAPTTPPVADSVKPPLQPTTHPRPLSSKAIKTIAIVSVVLVLFGGAVAYSAIAKPAAMSWLTGSKTPKATPSPLAIPTPTPVLGAEITPIPEPAIPANLNAQRIDSLAAYKAAYLATAVNGFFAVAPPTVSVAAVEPSTGQPYVVSTAVPTTLGQIRYWPGGVCSGTPKTPGSTGTKFLALQVLLEGDATPYCVEVK